MRAAMRCGAVLAALVCLLPARAEIERFVPEQAPETEMWRLTNDPSWRDWANYHIRNCWSPDGRYVCTVRYRAYESSMDGGPFVRVIEAGTGEVVRSFELANTPRWAHEHNWLFFVQREEDSGLWNIMWWDVDADRLVRLQGQSSYLGCTDYRDEWLYASAVTMPDGSSAAGARIPIRGGQPEPLPVGGQLEANPGHPKVFTRISNYFEPFKPTRLFFDPDGGDLSVASTCLQQCHQSWSGGGEWYLFGNQQMRGRRWDEPFPSNWHYLTAIGCGDICRGSRTDRYIVGSGATRQIVIADTRSGDGRVVLPLALSYIHDSSNYQFSGDSAYYDNDAKGSPDGTKICFASCYDLKDGPITRIAERSSPETGPGLHVDSTEGFAEQGRLSIGPEVIGYERKTDTTFDGLTRGMYDTGRPYVYTWSEEERREKSEYPDDLRPGWVVTSFDARMIPDEQIAGLQMPSRFDRESFADRDSPLVWQRRTDVYVAVARTPDRPWLRATADGVELIPGELHFETRGYRVLRDGERITNELVAAGATIELPGGGEYTAVAVEWSGLESEPSRPLRVNGAMTLRLLAEAPEDFAWMHERWLVGGEPAEEAQARQAPEAVREIGHRYDGVIHREWYEAGLLVRRHDLTPDGLAIRRTFHEDGRPARREYYDREGTHLSVELFDADGFITESVYYRGGEEYEHWWFIKGTPVKLWTARGGHHTASPERGGTYVKQGIDWVKID